MKRLAAFALLILARTAFAASPSFDAGKELYLFNKPSEARPLLEKAITEDPTNELAYLYLGIVYEQLKDPKKAISVFKRGLVISSEYRVNFLYDIGLNYYKQKEYTFAEQSFTDAITEDPAFSAAYRDRANTRMELEKYDGAVADYTEFLSLKPDDHQRPQIEEVLRRLGLMMDAIAQKKADELARQKALMNSVLDALKNASDDTKNVSVESLKFKQGSEDVDIED